tara:strand:+ start:363 stop:827 length:465 start_codon:yes stop_codon:yes gene_type:complete
MKKINQKNFKKTLSKFSTGVTVIAINNQNKIIGKTVNSFSSLSLSPPLVMFSLDKNSSSINNFKRSKFISINFLSKKQIKISLNFAKKNSKWNETEFFYGQFKTPIIKDCLSNLECITEKLIPMGDHIIFICKVINVLNNNKAKPLIYYNSQYL